ncbi:MAG: hypothetical protein NTX86_00155 [Candidatus Dependentiae bacterium]|nr:hypothetical protein [Candidatus Dependentiae bacterium]
MYKFKKYGYSFFVVLFMVHCPLYPVVVGSNSAVSVQAAVTFPYTDNNNTILGFASCPNGFTLDGASTTCTYNAYYPVAGRITLNGGSFFLSKDLAFKPSLLATTGTIDGNSLGMQFTTTASLQWAAAPLNQLYILASAVLPSAVYSVNWAYDSGFVATGDNTGNLRVFSFDGRNLVQRATVNLTNVRINGVSWHPSDYYIAAVRNSGTNQELYVYRYNVGPATLTQTTAIELGFDAFAVSWHPTGNFLAIGNADTANEIRVYSAAAGVLTALTTFNIAPNANVSNDALSFSPTGTYLAAGVASNAGSELYVYTFNGTTLAINAQAEVGVTVSCLDYSHTNSVIAVGLISGTQCLRVYQHDPGAGTLTELTSARVGETVTVNSVHWSPDGTQLVMGRNTGTGTEFRLYAYDSTAATLTQLYGENSTSVVRTVAWSPNAKYVARGDDAFNLRIYNRVSPALDYFVFNNIKMALSSNTTLKNMARFKGVCALDGKGITLDLSASFTATNGNAILVDAGSSLLLQNMTISGVSANKMACLDNLGTLSLENVTWIQTDSTVFSLGRLYISGELRVTGTTVFAYTSNQQSTIGSNSMLYFDSGMTFSYNPSSSANNLLAFADRTSLLHLYETTLQTTTTALQLTKGTLVIDGVCPVVSGAQNVGQAISFGDGVSANNNLTIRVLPESGLNVVSGIVRYNNI